MLWSGDFLVSSCIDHEPQKTLPTVSSTNRSEKKALDAGALKSNHAAASLPSSTSAARRLLREMTGAVAATTAFAFACFAFAFFSG